MLLMIIVGDILGGGIYALVGEVGAETGNTISTGFLVAFLLAGLTACAYAERAEVPARSRRRPLREQGLPSGRSSPS